MVRQHVEQLVGPLAHLADALAEVLQQRFAAQLLHLVVEDDALQVAGAGDAALLQGADEDVALPRREQVAGVDGEAGGGDGGQPHHDRRLVAVAGRVRRDPRAGIEAPEAHQRPAVVAAGLEDVELVAAVGAVLVLPDVPGPGVQREAEGVAVPDGVDLRPVARLAHEGVVVGHRAVVVEPQHLAAQAHGVLGGHEEVAVQGPDASAGRHVDLAVGAERDAAVEPRVGVERLGDHEVLDVVQRVPLEPAPREGRRAAAVVVPLGVGHVDQPVVGELGVEGDVHQAAVAVGPHLGQARDGLRVELIVPHHAQPAVPLGDEHAAVGHERDGPGVRQPSRHHADADLVLLGGVDDPGAVAERRHRHADGLVLGEADRDEAEQQRRRQENRTSDLHANLPDEPMAR